MIFKLPNLRETFEEKGFAVRSWIPEPRKIRKVTHKAMKGSEKQPFMEKIVQNATARMAQQEARIGRDFEYGAIVDFPGTVKTLAFARIDQNFFEEMAYTDEEKTVTTRNSMTGEEQACRVIGYIFGGTPIFHCDDATTMSYFDGSGKLGTTTFIDYVEEKDAEGTRLKKSAKRKAQKERRKAGAVEDE